MTTTPLAPRLYDAVAARLAEVAAKRSYLTNKYGQTTIGEVQLPDVFTSGSRVPILYCGTTSVHQTKGLQVQVKSPARKSGVELRSIKDYLGLAPEELWLLYLLHDVPPAELLGETRAVMQDLQRDFPTALVGVISSLPIEMPSMSMLSAAINVLSARSDYELALKAGTASQNEMLKLTLNDALRAMAWMPKLVAAVVSRKRGEGFPLAAHPFVNDQGMGTQFAQWLGLSTPTSGAHGQLACKWLNLLLNLLSDHEAGNGSAHACAVTSSCEGSIFSSLSSMTNALGGRRHGDAAKNALAEIQAIHRRFGGVPTAEQARAYAAEVREKKGRMAGMGHGVLFHDVRFEIEHAFALEHFGDDPLVQTMDRLAREVPALLATPEEIASGKRPINPNVDFGSGVITRQWIPEPEVGTLIFALARVIGCTAQAVHNRGQGLPLERQESVTLADLFTLVGEDEA